MAFETGKHFPDQLGAAPQLRLPLQARCIMEGSMTPIETFYSALVILNLIVPVAPVWCHSLEKLRMRKTPVPACQVRVRVLDRPLTLTEP